MVRARPLLSYVVALAIALTAPPLAVSVLIAKQWVAGEQARFHVHVTEIADSAAAHVDRYIAGKIAMLQALATSPALAQDDFRALDAQARQLLDLQGVTIVLRELDGQQRVNTRRPWGTPLPRVRNLSADAHVFQTGQPHVSDLYHGVVSQQTLIRIIVPVIKDGAVRYTLAASLTPNTLADLLRASGVAQPHSVAIADREGQLLARAFGGDDDVGKRVPGFGDIVGSEGSWAGESGEGRPVVGSFRRSTLSGWAFIAAAERSELDRPFRRSLILLAAFALGLGVIAIVFSFLIVRRVIRSQQQITDAAHALGEGVLVQAPHTPVIEANVIGEALADASRKLNEQADALIEANHDLERRVADRTRTVTAQSVLLEVTLQTMDQGLMVIDATGRIPICNRRARDLLDLPDEFMATRPTFDELVARQIARGDFARSGKAIQDWVGQGGLEAGAHRYERERPNGTIIEVNTIPMPEGGFVRTYTDITNHRRSEQLARHMAEHDSLTGLSNRSMFRSRLKTALAGGGPVALLWLDLDRFKAINDTLGHPAGDQLLREVARRVRAELRHDEVAARLGGDEFAIIIEGDDVADEIRPLAERLVDSIRRPYLVAGEVAECGVSIGVAIGPEHGREIDDLIKAADTALYRAKDEGRNTVRIYDTAMDIAARERRILEHDLSLAVSRGEFELRLQPIVNLQRERLDGFEALVRWVHPTKGEVQPGAFIALAEETRLIAPIGAWVLREACRQAATWPSHIQVAVNVSAAQFDDPAFASIVLSALAEAGLPAHRLELEITESILISHGDPVLQALQTLRAGGVRIALDDFGTGYSSLSYLHRFPVDRIKVDRSFVQGIRHGSGDATTEAIVRSIVNLGTSLGAAVTAEGVETAEQLAFVRQVGCTDAQGFLFGRPMRVAEAQALMREGLAAAA